MRRLLPIIVLGLAVLGTTTASAATKPVYWTVPQATRALSQVGVLHTEWVPNLDDTSKGRYDYGYWHARGSQTCHGIGAPHRGKRYRAFACVVTPTDRWPQNQIPFKAWIVPRGSLWTPGLEGGGVCVTGVALSVCTKPRMPNDPRVCTRGGRRYPLAEVDSCVWGKASTAFAVADPIHRQNPLCVPTGFLRFRCSQGEPQYRVAWANRAWSITKLT